MRPAFFRFPQTPHIAWLGESEPREDKLLSPMDVQSLLSGSVVVEEKLDGANLGFSVAANGELQAQNRGQYLVAPHAGQFRRLHDWLPLHGNDLVAALGSDLIAFGEWCAARHSLSYDRLPDWWLLFDIYDRNAGRFWSTQRRDALARELGLATVPRVADGHQTSASLQHLVDTERSRYRDGPLEGIVARKEDKDWLLASGKLVRADFTQHIDTHWRSRRLEWNRVSWTDYTGREVT